MEVDNNESSDDDYEEEECLVYLDFQSKIKSEALEKQNLKIKMIGIDTDEPIVQVNNKIFRGVFEHPMGTNVFFATNPNPPAMDPNFESIPSTMYQYHSQSDKVLKMERIFITPKQDNEDEDEPNETQSDEDVVPNESYSDALDLFLKFGEPPPRSLSGSDVIKPSEFQTYFRPRLEQMADVEANEEIMDAAETNDNDDITGANVTEGSDGGNVNDMTETFIITEFVGDGLEEPTEPTEPSVKVEAIKQEKTCEF